MALASYCQVRHQEHLLGHPGLPQPHHHLGHVRQRWTSLLCDGGGRLYLNILAVFFKYIVQHSQSNREIFNVSRVEIHPDFDLDTFTNNLAVVELSREVEISDDIMPACLMDTASHEVGGSLV